MRNRILAEQYTSSRLLTTADVARALDLTTRSVRRLAHGAQLDSEMTESGQRLFRKGEVVRLGQRRMEARLARVTALRPKRWGIRGEPRQMSLFGADLRLVPPSASPCPHADIDHT